MLTFRCLRIRQPLEQVRALVDFPFPLATLSNLEA